MRIRSLFTIVSSCALMVAAASATHAQATQSVYVPKGKSMGSKFGGWGEAAPFEQAPSRLQQIIASSQIATKSASIKSFAYRGREVSSPSAGVTIQKLLVEMGYARTTPQTMSTNYNGNRGSGMTTVLSGKFMLANLSPQDSASKFQIVFPLQKPFAYTASKGGLLLDVTNSDKYYYQGWNYELDATPMSGGHKQKAGFCGEQPNGTQRSGGGCAMLEINGDPILGRSVELELLNLRKNWPAAAILGNWIRPWGQSLWSLGATKNSWLHVTVDRLIPLTGYFRKTFPYNNTWAAKTKVAVPNSSALNNAGISVQAFVWHGVGGALPVTTSEAYFVRFSDRDAESQALFGPITGNGYYFSGSRTGGRPVFYGGPVVRLQGTFN